MKKFEEQIKEWFQKFLKKEPSYGRKFLRPSRDWGIILFFTFFCLILCAIGSYYFYEKVDSGEYFSTTEENIENEAKINISLLSKTVSDLNIRAENLKEAEAGNIAPADPAK
jgi:hypothetical protein